MAYHEVGMKFNNSLYFPNAMASNTEHLKSINPLGILKFQDILYKRDVESLDWPDVKGQATPKIYLKILWQHFQENPN